MVLAASNDEPLSGTLVVPGSPSTKDSVSGLVPIADLSTVSLPLAEEAKLRNSVQDRALN